MNEKDAAEEGCHLQFCHEGDIKHILITHLIKPEPVRDKHDRLHGEGEYAENNDEEKHDLEVLQTGMRNFEISHFYFPPELHRRLNEHKMSRSKADVCTFTAVGHETETGLYFYRARYYDRGAGISRCGTSGEPQFIFE